MIVLEGIEGKFRKENHLPYSEELEKEVIGMELFVLQRIMTDLTYLFMEMESVEGISGRYEFRAFNKRLSEADEEAVKLFNQFVTATHDGVSGICSNWGYAANFSKTKEDIKRWIESISFPLLTKFYDKLTSDQKKFLLKEG